jgi:hypothetical protein
MKILKLIGSIILLPFTLVAGFAKAARKLHEIVVGK